MFQGQFVCRLSSPVFLTMEHYSYVTDQCVHHNSSMLRLESGYEARKELLSNHVKAVQERRVQELQEYTEKSQQQVE